MLPFDTQFIRRLRSGEVGTFESLFRALLPGMRRMAMRYFQSPFEQEEAIQEAFLAIHRQREHIDPLRADELQGWAFTVARRRMIDVLRARGAPAESLEQLSETVDWASEGPGPAETAEHEQVRALLSSFEARLKPSYRAFFHAVFVEGKDFDEAREVLGVGRLRARYLKKVLLTRLRGHAPLLEALGRVRS